jgi:hypothetical protein
MKPQKAIIKTPAPQPETEVAKFDVAQIDGFVHGQGYEVDIERALRCPCTVKASGSPLPKCMNCGGTGWAFLGRTESKVSMTNMNWKKNYLDWSEVNRGTAMVTARYVDRLAFMDRITVKKATSIHSQVLKPISSGSKLFSFTIYEPLSILEARMFISAEKPFKKLVQNTDYIIVDNRIEFDKRYHGNPDLSVSIIYEHHPQYHVIDIVRDIILKETTNCEGEIEQNNLPLLCVARRAHFVLDAPSLDKGLLLNE